MNNVLAVGGLKYAPAALLDGKLVRDAAPGEPDDAQVLARLDDFRKRLAADGWQPEVIACDRHDGYATTYWATIQRLPLVRVQHHRAHALAALWPDYQRPALALAFDGTGLGDDDTIWGGEFLALGDGKCERIAALQEMPLVGGEAAIREPARLLAGYLTALALPLPGNLAIPDELRRNLPQLLAVRVNTPRSSSAGRLFDAVAALLDLVPRAWAEGGAARALQALAETTDATTDLPVVWDAAVTPQRLQLHPLFAALLAAQGRGVPAAALARGFHAWLARASADAAARLAAERGRSRVVLAGGVWHNALLTRLLLADAALRGCEMILPPPESRDDRALAIGQLAAALGG